MDAVSKVEDGASGRYRRAAALMGGQALVLVVAAVAYVVETLRGEATDRSTVLMSIVLFLIAAAGLAALARGLRAGAPWARTPAVVWNLLLIPVGVSLFASAQPLLAAVVLAVSIGAVLAVVTGR